MKLIIKIMIATVVSVFVTTSFAVTTTSDKLIFAIDIVRHGDRTPIEDIPSSPYPWAQGLGQLTATGMHQENELGKKLRYRYIEHYHLLPAEYDGTTLYVRSTDVDRTLMSAESLLLGLYPLPTGPVIPQTDQYALPQGYQPIPIHTLPQKAERLLVPDNEYYHYDALMKKYIYTDKAWQAKNAELQSKYPAWSKATGINIQDIYQLGLIADALYIREIYHVPLPAGLTEADAQQIIAAGIWAFIYPYTNQKIVQVTTSKLFNTIKAELKNASEHKTTKKYLLFSAHDSTILGQMAALGAPLNRAPTYASDLNILLFQHGENNYYVEVTFNDNPVFIPKCGSTKCSLQQFLS